MAERDSTFSALWSGQANALRDHWSHGIPSQQRHSFITLRAAVFVCVRPVPATYRRSASQIFVIQMQEVASIVRAPVAQELVPFEEALLSARRMCATLALRGEDRLAAAAAGKIEFECHSEACAEISPC
ncbi:hypothetical protein AAFF_G00332350 [Aldrovandia affinis]|uniref:Uncharacterized protein n=1 Tax=Aldrovandia affinis TaxID=143900 RepID=A0AAD7WQ34_9TELE|nr:hypothetical protein AAFF_G00332350 [Aldrovandia affinis]